MSMETEGRKYRPRMAGRSVTMSVEGLGLRNPLTRSLTPEGENETTAERIKVLVFDKDNKFSYEAKVTSFIPSGDPDDKKSKGTMTCWRKILLRAIPALS